MFIKLTNANPIFVNQPIVIRKNVIISVYAQTVTREDGLTAEEVTFVYAGQDGTWEVQEKVDAIFDLLNSY